jgi:CheY-like chemotaxis protein
MGPASDFRRYMGSSNSLGAMLRFTVRLARARRSRSICRAFTRSRQLSRKKRIRQLTRGSVLETVLVVEDDADVRSYSCETLRELGYNVLEAETARSALQVLDTRPEIRVLFTDVGLPGGMNGRQLVEEARKRRPDLRLLFTTGYARNAIVHDGRLDSGVELITKPFSQAALAGKLRDIIDSARTPGRVLLVEDEALIQMMATDCSR